MQEVIKEAMCEYIYEEMKGELCVCIHTSGLHVLLRVLSACVCVYMCACVCVRMAYVCVRMLVYMHCILLCTRARLCVCSAAVTCTDVSICTRVYSYVCRNVCICNYAIIRISMHLHARLCLCASLYVSLQT